MPEQTRSIQWRCSGDAPFDALSGSREYHQPMEAWDDDQRVRPIPIEDPFRGADPLQADGDPWSTPDGRAGRRWIPFAAAIGAIVVITASVAAFGALRYEDEPPTGFDAIQSPENATDVPTTTVPAALRQLDELLPGVSVRLTLIAERDDTLWALLWDPSFREPKAVSLGIESTPTSRLSRAEFDRSGRFVAVEACGHRTCNVYVGSPSDMGAQPALGGILGFTWHASEVGRLSWIVPVADGYAVRTGTVDPLTMTIKDEETAFVVPEPVRLVQWDALGFVLGSIINEHETAAHGPDGEALWTVSGSASTGTATIVAVLDEAAGWVTVDRATGVPIEAVGGPANGAANQSLVFVTTSDSADLIARLDAERTDGSSSLMVIGGSMAAVRVVTISQQYAPVGFTDDGSYFLLIGHGRRVVFVDWRRGASYEVVAPEGYDILGLDLG